MPLTPRILIVAENASSRFGGEAILPWHYFRLLRRRGVDARLLVHERVRAELQATFPDDRDRLHFIPDLPSHVRLNRWSQRLPRAVSNLTTGAVLSFLTQTALRREALRLIREHRIQLIHQPAPVSPKQPSFLFNMPVPLVVGPMNGGMSYPPAMNWLEPLWQRRLTVAGRAAANLMNLAIPGKRHADVLLVANERTRRALPWGVRGRVVEMVENGVDLSLFERPERRPERQDDAIRFAFVGRLIDLKGVDLLLEAMARTRAAVKLDVIGDGPMRGTWQALAERLNLADRVTFHGFIPQAQCPALLASADALVLPSLHECGGAVVLEAMAMGLPVIASNWGGPADYLDETCGVLIEPRGREPFIADLAAAMTRLADDAALRITLGEAGRRRAAERFDWDRKAAHILALYESATEAPMQVPPLATTGETNPA